MSHQQRIFVDFLKTDREGRLLLRALGTRRDLEALEVVLDDGLPLRVYSDDLDENGEPDPLIADGVVQRNEELSEWVLLIDNQGIRHASSRL